MHYSNYSVQDFVADRYFREWVFSPGKETNDFWENWMIENPSKANLVLSARHILFNMAFDEHRLNSAEIDELWDSIESKIAGSENVNQNTVHRYLVPNDLKMRRDRKVWWYVAASVAAFFVINLLLFYGDQQQINKSFEQIATDFGETQTITLTDGSIVRLNANSTLRYEDNWDDASPREVWLSGEAYFNVVHTKSNSSFTVYSNGIAVNVLGTEFNVYGRGKMAEVVLEKGKVQLKSVETNQEIILKPGDFVSYNRENYGLNKTQVDTKLYTSWKDKHMFFKGATLEQISIEMKEVYNLDFYFIDANLAREQFTGVIPTDNEEILIKALSEAFNIDIETKNRSVTLRRKKN